MPKKRSGRRRGKPGLLNYVLPAKIGADILFGRPSLGTNGLVNDLKANRPLYETFSDAANVAVMEVTGIHPNLGKSNLPGPQVRAALLTENITLGLGVWAGKKIAARTGINRALKRVGSPILA